MSSLNSQQNKDVLEAEVPPEILEQFKILNDAMNKNKELAQEFLLNLTSDDLDKLNGDIFKVFQLTKELKSAIRKERIKNNALSVQVARDGQMAEQVNRRYEMLTKNPQYGRAQAIEYMHTIAGEHENNLLESEAIITKVEQMLRNLMDIDKEKNLITEKDLSEHIERFDEIFGIVSSQICNVNEEVERLKEVFLENQTRIYGHYARNPFDKQKERKKVVEAFSNLKGLDAFPSQNAVMSLSEFMPRQQQMPGGPFGAAVPNTLGTFGNAAGTSLFAQKPSTTGGAFSLFNQQAQSAISPFTTLPTSSASLGFGSTSQTTLFGPKTTTINQALPAAQSFFGASTATGIPTAIKPFGTPASTTNMAFSFTANGVAPLATGQSFFGALPAAKAGGNNQTFGSTLNSATSGTLFSGSVPANKGFNVGAKPLFGAK